MRTLWALVIGLSLMGSVAAQPGSVTDKPIRVGSGKLVMVGDSEGQVLAKFGKAPDRETVLETGAGGAVGQRWVYIEPGYSGRIVTLELYGGEVRRLWEERIK